MESELIHILLGFLEGFALIISPCILPVLPIILAGSLAGSKKRPLGIIIGFVVTFAFFTLFTRKLVQYTGIDSGLIRDISFSLLFLLGVIMISNTLSDKFTALTNHIENIGSSLRFVNNPQSGFWGGFFFGTLVTLIWTPCAGPILAAIIVQTVMQHTSLISFLVLLAFALGAAIPMFLIALFGRKIMSKMNFVKSRVVLFRKILGAIIITTVAVLAFGEGLIPSAFAAPATRLEDGVSAPYAAPALQNISGWINSGALSLNKLRGKVVLVDFWTYTCPHCVSTIPHINQWYSQYSDKGLVIIGVHGPSYEYQQSKQNVADAVKRLNIHFPVALDNHFATWDSYGTQYWPTFYLIDKQGNIVYTHTGEGDYDTIENNIRFLLGM